MRLWTRRKKCKSGRWSDNWEERELNFRVQSSCATLPYDTILQPPLVQIQCITADRGRNSYLVSIVCTLGAQGTEGRSCWVQHLGLGREMECTRSSGEHRHKPAALFIGTGGEGVPSIYIYLARNETAWMINMETSLQREKQEKSGRC